MSAATQTRAAAPVVVVGAGAAGLGCALSAAAGGADVVLLEQTAQLGGTVQQALIHTIGGLFDDQGELLNAGLPGELRDRLSHACAWTRKRRIGRTWVLGVDPGVYAEVIAGWIGEARRIVVVRQVRALGVELAGDRVDALRFTTDHGVQTLRPCALVDTTGDASVVRAIDGALVHEGVALGGVIVQLRGVDPDALQFPRGVAILRHIRQAVEARTLPPECATLWLDTGVHPDEVYVKFNIETEAYDRARMAAVMEQLLTFLRALAGLAGAYVARQGRLGIRDGGRIVGEYCLTEADIVAGRRFADVACKACWPIEHWHPTSGLQLTYLPEGQVYEVPLRSLKVRGFTNLWAAGKCLSAEPRAQASARVAGTCWAMGAAVARNIVASP